MPEEPLEAVDSWIPAWAEPRCRGGSLSVEATPVPIVHDVLAEAHRPAEQHDDLASALRICLSRGPVVEPNLCGVSGSAKLSDIQDLA